MESEQPSRTVNIIIKNPAAHIKDFNTQVQLSDTVRCLKQQLEREYINNPPTENQKLIYAGKLLQDSDTFAKIFEHADLNTTQKLHIVTKPASTIPQPQTQPAYVPPRQYVPFQQLPPHVQQQLEARMRQQAQQAQPEGAPADVNAVQNPELQPRQNGDGIGNSIWLVLKLAFMVYILSQGGSTNRVVILSVSAVLVYLYQTGLLQSAFGSLNPGQNLGRGIMGELVLPFFYSLVPSWTPPDSAQPAGAPRVEPEQVQNMGLMG